MASSIDATKPADGVDADKSDLRANLLAAKNEIEALQAGGTGSTVTAVTGAQVVTGYTITRLGSNMFIDVGAQADDGTITLPVSPTSGDRILIRRGSGDFNCVVNGSVNIVEDGVTLFIYDGSGWRYIHFNAIDASQFATAAQGVLADSAVQPSDLAPTQVASDASPYTLPLTSRADFSVEIPTHTTNIEFVVPKTAPAGSEWHLVIEHSGCYVVIEDDVGSILPNMALNTSGDATESKRMIIGGDVIVRVRSNTGSAPVVALLGDVETEDTITGALTLNDEIRIGRLLRYTGSGSTWTLDALSISGEIGVENDGTGAITFSTGTISAFKGSATLAINKMGVIRYYNGGTEAHVVTEF